MSGYNVYLSYIYFWFNGWLTFFSIFPRKGIQPFHRYLPMVTIKIMKKSANTSERGILGDWDLERRMVLEWVVHFYYVWGNSKHSPDVPHKIVEGNTESFGEERVKIVQRICEGMDFEEFRIFQQSRSVMGGKEWHKVTTRKSHTMAG